MPALRDILSVTCLHCGTAHHVAFGSSLPAECPACWESWEVTVLYRVLRPRKRHVNISNVGEQTLSDDLKRKWKQSLPQFRDISSWSKLDGFDLAWILCVCPECVRQIPFKTLDSGEWRIPLQKNEVLLKPYWTVCFGSSYEISKVLRADPSMIQYVDLSQSMEARHWWAVLDQHPDLVHNTPDNILVNMPSKTWVRILKDHPQAWVETKTPWSSLSGSLWAELLLARPELATHCDWHKLCEQDWNAILFTPTTPPLWPLIHDVLCGRNLMCIMQHADLLKYLDWDTAPLMELRELIVGANLDIQPPSWNVFSNRIIGDKSYWQSHESVRQFIPPSPPARSASWSFESVEKADLAEITKFENRLALICFMGWDLECFAHKVKLSEMSAGLFVKYPGIGKKCGWRNLPVEMHYDVVRIAPWLREYYPWTEWSKGKLRRLFAIASVFKTEYREKRPFNYIFIQFGLLIFIVALVACSIGAGWAYWRYAWNPNRQAIVAPDVTSAKYLPKNIPDSVAVPHIDKLNEFKDLAGKANSLFTYLSTLGMEKSMPGAWAEIIAERKAIASTTNVDSAIEMTKAHILQMNQMLTKAKSSFP